MTKATREMLENGRSVDETDRIPDNIEITNFDLLMYVVAIVGHFVDMGVDINVATRYYLADKMVAFGFTVASILMPAIVNTAISVRMYAQDQQLKTQPDEFMKRRTLRIIMLVLLMASTMRVTDAFIWALRSRRAERKRDLSSQRLYYRLMLKEDSDAALLRIFECFLEAAPQQLLQLTLLLRMDDQFTVHQLLAISSSIIGMGWALSSYQRAIRFAQQDKQNMNWVGSLLQILWHFLVSLSRITSLAMVAYLFPFWLLLAAATHILFMTAWLQIYDKSPFCAQSKLAELLFSLVLGIVYLFTYILPVDGRTRYRFAFYYSLCFLENIACAVLWYLYASEGVRETVFFVPVLVVSVASFLVGMVLMVVYYVFAHPKVRKGAISDFMVSYKASGPMSVVNRDIVT